MRTLIEELLVLAGCVVALTTVLAVAQWWTGALIKPDLVVLGAIFGVTAYVVAGFVRLMLRAINRFTRRSRRAKVDVNQTSAGLSDRRNTENQKLRTRSAALMLEEVSKAFCL